MLRVLQLLHQLHLPLLLLRLLLGQKCELLLLRLRHLRVRQLLSGSVQVDLWSFRIMLLLPLLSCPLLWIPQLLFCQRCLGIPVPSSIITRHVAGFLPEDLIWQRWLLLCRVLQLALQRRNQPRSMVPDRREARCLRQREAASCLPQLRRHMIEAVNRATRHTLQRSHALGAITGLTLPAASITGTSFQRISNRLAQVDREVSALQHVRIDWRSWGKLWLPLQLADDSVNVRVMHERSLKLLVVHPRLARWTCHCRTLAGKGLAWHQR